MRGFGIVADGDAAAGRNRLQWYVPGGADAAVGVVVRYTEGATCSPPTAVAAGTALPVAPPVADSTQLAPHPALVLDREYCYSVWLDYGGGELLGAEREEGTPVRRHRPGEVEVLHRHDHPGRPDRGPRRGDRPVERRVHPRDAAESGRRRNLADSAVAPTQSRVPGPATVAGRPSRRWLAGVRLDPGRPGARGRHRERERSVVHSPPGGRGPGGAGGIFTAFGGAYDYILVGTSAATAFNRLYALDPFTGTVIDSFPQAADGYQGQVGAILGMPTVDYNLRQVYFASVAKGPTIWCVALGSAPDALRPSWSPITSADIQGSVVLLGGRVYAGTVGNMGSGIGQVFSVNAVNGTRYSANLDGAVLGFLFPDRRNNDLYAATHGLTQDRVEAITDTGLLAPKWGIEPGLTAPSTVLHHPGDRRHLRRCPGRLPQRRGRGRRAQARREQRGRRRLGLPGEHGAGDRSTDPRPRLRHAVRGQRGRDRLRGRAGLLDRAPDAGRVRFGPARRAGAQRACPPESPRGSSAD